MSATKLRPEDLTATVREVFPPPPPIHGWLGFYYDSSKDSPEDTGWYCSGRVHPDREDALCELAGFRPFEGSALIEVGQASVLFAPAPVEAERVETTKTVAYCDELDARYGKPAATVEISELDDRHMRMASPEAQKKFKDMAGIVDVGMNHIVGVATEPTPLRKMPEVICDAAFWLNQVADGFEYDDNDLRALAERVHRWWRTYVHPIATDRDTCVCPDCRQWDEAQPVAISNDLLFVLNAALHSANNDKGWAPDYAEQIRAAHRAVVAQYGRKP